MRPLTAENHSEFEGKRERERDADSLCPQGFRWHSIRRNHHAAAQMFSSVLALPLFRRIVDLDRRVLRTCRERWSRALGHGELFAVRIIHFSTNLVSSDEGISQSRRPLKAGQSR